MLLNVQLGLMITTIAGMTDIGNTQELSCLNNGEAYLGNGCCAGTCGDTYMNCFDCPTTQKQDPVNYGGPSCFRNGSCIAEEPAGACAAPSVKNERDNYDGKTEYSGWCVCPEGSFCSGDVCNAVAPRQLWNPDEVSVHFA